MIYNDGSLVLMILIVVMVMMTLMTLHDSLADWSNLICRQLSNSCKVDSCFTIELVLM